MPWSAFGRMKNRNGWIRFSSNCHYIKFIQNQLYVLISVRRKRLERIISTRETSSIIRVVFFLYFPNNVTYTCDACNVRSETEWRNNVDGSSMIETHIFIYLVIYFFHPNPAKTTDQIQKYCTQNGWHRWNDLQRIHQYFLGSAHLFTFADQKQCFFLTITWFRFLGSVVKGVKSPTAAWITAIRIERT